MKLTKNIKQIKGDASFRSFYRNKKKNLSSIIVYALKDKKLNLCNPKKFFDFSTLNTGERNIALHFCKIFS